MAKLNPLVAAHMQKKIPGYAAGGDVAPEGNAQLADAIPPEQLQNLKAMRYELPSQTTPQSSPLPEYSDVFGKPAAQDIVNRFRSAPPITAEQSAEVLAPKELPAVNGPRGMTALTPEVLPPEAPPMRGAAAMFPGETMPAPYTGGLPAATGPLAAASMMGGELAAPALAGVGLGNAAVKGLDSLTDGKYSDIVGAPGAWLGKKVYGGEDETPEWSGTTGHSDRPGTPNGPSLFDMVSAKYQDKTPEMTSAEAEAPTVTKGTRAPAAGDDGADDADQKKNAAVKTPSVNPIVARYLKDREDMKTAQDKANTNQAIAGISRAGGLAASSTYGATRGLDEGTFKELDANANRPVAALQATQEAGKKSLDEQQHMMKAQAEQEASDPNSPLAKQLRQVYGPIFKKAGLPTNSLDTMSAADIKAYAQNPLEFIEKEKVLESNKQLQLEVLKSRMATEQNNKNVGHLQTAQTGFNHDATKANQAMQAADDALANIQLAKSNPVAYSGTAIQMARAMAGGQRINKQELDRMGGSQAVMDRLGQVAKEMQSGTLSDKNAQFFTEVAQSMKKAAMDDVHGIAKRHAQQYSQLSGEPLETAYQKISGTPMPQAAAPSPQGAPTGDAVQVKDPAGKIRWIPKDQVKAALANHGTLVGQ